MQHERNTVLLIISYSVMLFPLFCVMTSDQKPHATRISACLNMSLFLFCEVL